MQPRRPPRLRGALPTSVTLNYHVNELLNRTFKTEFTRCTEHREDADHAEVAQRVEMTNSARISQHGVTSLVAVDAAQLNLWIVLEAFRRLLRLNSKEIR